MGMRFDLSLLPRHGPRPTAHGPSSRTINRSAGCSAAYSAYYKWPFTHRRQSATVPLLVAN